MFSHFRRKDRLPKVVGQSFVKSADKVLLTALLVVFAASPAFAFNGSQYAREAKISIRQARTIATKACPGKIVDQELEREKGGSGLRYSFDIKQGKVTREVGVDAKTGKVLENSKEGPNAD
ncbi:MAG TPA: PepSY domain-containing protein [Desulfuromonadales bacterium]|nr:PepSY domain-containing protein [Desulfuromonadales bacterium]